jgi:SAM-dependent methyltransferase
MTGLPGARLFVGLLVVSAAASPASPRLTGAASPSGVVRMTVDDVRPVLRALGDSVPAGLRNAASSGDEVQWSAWLKARDLDIRRRIATGDEDSVVNLMLYGTGFTRQPRATGAAAASAPAVRVEALMDGRLGDLAAAIEVPGADERLRFARQVVERHGITVGPASREATRRYLLELRSRVLAENDRYIRRLAEVPVADPSQQRALQATLYRDRGLSSDTSLRVDFALEQALAVVRDRGELARRPLERVGIVGPGLDFVDKAQGYDLYPVQMIQPFALADSLRRLGIGQRAALTTLDISPRVMDHLRTARQRAAHLQPYRLNLVIEQDIAGARLAPVLIEYWQRFGDRVGTAVAVDVQKPFASHVRARSVDVRPEVVLDVTGVELNIVLERLSNVDRARAFDLIVATNVLIYYDTSEQALAVRNMASMLRDGGLLITNQPVPVADACGLASVLVMSVPFDEVQSAAGSHERGDSIFIYRKSAAPRGSDAGA